MGANGVWQPAAFWGLASLFARQDAHGAGSDKAKVLKIRHMRAVEVIGRQTKFYE